jgi:prepilin-type N-terminal cleavage/methylation domain-containing protein
MRSRRRTTTDAGFTLIEAVICIALMGLLSTVIAAAIVVTMKSSPAVADRADAAVNVQGLVTWLPQDVDSATPGTFDTTDTTTSGCAGADPGRNVLKMTWHEQITSLINYSVSYRYIPLPNPADGGKIVRVYCTAGGPRNELTVSGVIPAWVVGDEPVRIALTDSPADADSLIDSAKVTVEPVVGKTIVIDATTKNLNETLSSPPPPPPPVTPPPSPTNNAPVAVNSAQTAKAMTDVAMNVSASDLDNDPLTVSLLVIPAGWTVTTTGGLGIVVNAPLLAIGTTGSISFRVTDTSGATATSFLDVTVVPAILNQPPTASSSAGSTTAGVPVTIALVASDPENAALSTTVSGVPADWTVTSSGASVTVTTPNTAPAGSTTLNYTVADQWGATASSTLTITVTAPPPCVVTGPTLSRSTDPVKKNDPDSLTHDITVTINIVSGYCVGLSLRYDTGAPNSQYVRIFGDAGTTRSVTLPNHPSPELWSVGTHALDVWDGTPRIIATTNLVVTP